jgi:hypothetical protein
MRQEPSRARFVLLVLPLLVLGVLLGCAEQAADPLSEPAYEREFRVAIDRFHSAGPDADSLEDDASLSEQGQVARALIERLRTMADELDGLEPPTEIEVAHRSWVEGLRGISEDLGPLAVALARGDRGKVASLSRRRLVRRENFRKLALAGLQFERRGYDLNIRKVRLPVL